MAKKAKVNTPMPTVHVATVAVAPLGKPGEKDPCSHRRNKKEKTKFVVYWAPEVSGKPPVPTGRFYVGRTRGTGDVSKIVLKRQQGHHRKDIGTLTDLCVTDTYSACRGAEQKHYADLVSKNAHIISARKKGRGKQIAPIASENDKKADYEECAKRTANATKPPSCPVCAA